MATIDRQDDDSASNPIRVVIAEDDPMLRAALVALINEAPGFELAAVAADAATAIAGALEHRPNVVLLDIRMPGGGIHAAREIHQSAPTVRIVALSAYGDRDTVFQMLAAGAVAYLVKGAGAQEILDALGHAARGDAVLASALPGNPSDDWVSGDDRERLADARTIAQIASVTETLGHGATDAQ